MASGFMAAIVTANSPAPKPGPQIHPPARSCERFAAVFPPAWQQGGAHSARQLKAIAAPGPIAAHAGRTDVPAAGQAALLAGADFQAKFSFFWVAAQSLRYIVMRLW